MSLVREQRSESSNTCSKGQVSGKGISGGFHKELRVKNSPNLGVVLGWEKLKLKASPKLGRVLLPNSR